MAGRTCMEAALAKLNYRMRSASELRSSLKEMGYEDAEIEDTINELKNFGYVNDQRYSEEFIRSSARKNWSTSRMVRSLKEKGIPAEDAEKAMREHIGSEDEGQSFGSYDRERALETGLKLADEQIRKGKPMDDRFFGRVGRRLMSLGYESGVCYYVIGVIRERRKYPDEEEEL